MSYGTGVNALFGRAQKACFHGTFCGLLTLIVCGQYFRGVFEARQKRLGPERKFGRALPLLWN